MAWAAYVCAVFMTYLCAVGDTVSVHSSEDTWQKMTKSGDDAQDEESGTFGDGLFEILMA